MSLSNTAPSTWQTTAGGVGADSFSSFGTGGIGAGYRSSVASQTTIPAITLAAIPASHFKTESIVTSLFSIWSRER